MEKLNIGKKNLVAIIILFVAAALAIRFNIRPKLYYGVIASLVAIFFIGLSSNRKLGAILGGVSMILGLVLRKAFPEVMKLKGDKLAAFMEQYNAYEEFLGKYFLLYIACGIAIGFLGGYISEILEEDKNKKFSTNRIVYLGIFIALSVVINTMRVGSISFGGFPIIMSGYFLGPINGFIVGGLSDLVGFMARPSSNAFNPIFTLTSALTGAIPVVVTRMLGEKYPNYSFWKVLVGIFVGQMLTSVIIVPIAQVLLYGKNTFIYYFSKAFAKQIVSIPIYAFLTVSVNDSLKRAVNFDKIRN